MISRPYELFDPRALVKYLQEENESENHPSQEETDVKSKRKGGTEEGGREPTGQTRPQPHQQHQRYPPRSQRSSS